MTAKKIRSGSILGLIFFSFASISIAGTGVIEGRKRVAIIGGGGAGVTASWLLDEDCDVTLFEKENRLGGDAHTVDLNLNEKIYSVDAGFEFLNIQGFPKFIRLLDELKVKRNDFQLTASFTAPDKKSFVITPISDDGLAIGSILKPHNLIKLIRLKSFFDKARSSISIASEGNIAKELKSMQEYFKEIAIEQKFLNEFLLPMLASGWGIKCEEILTWSMENVLRTVLAEPDGIAAPTWIEIDGGTRQYIDAAHAELKNARVHLNTQISSIRYLEEIDKYELTSSQGVQIFDELVLAVPPHQIQEMLSDIKVPEIVFVRDALAKVEFYPSKILLHGDPSFMPKKKRHWAVVNIRSNNDGSQFGMTMFKKWRYPENTPIFKSWFLDGDPIPSPLYAEVSFLHRKLNMNYVHAKAAVQTFQGSHHLWFVGTHTLGDRHENAIISAMNVAEKIAPHAKRLRILNGE